ncbi:MAG: TetR/AcrR family transcriptional regulator [Candidatus Dormibacteraeota bacterium]|uniref:TetR/AcrR family transcriptional regulator n=1 Tax=Candidatus Dormiibacter inghamiae TaxID=3127013 RepID=A0A934KEG0_9BACT|nr:TetR/AcrR family transcriptional regulator [Candidatus Dormibacteraeota bacterium]MBJ7605583.1 TetR/AcrR family transcriptional regulator [Candidatus Dormibacteraeota bacterium]
MSHHAPPTSTATRAEAGRGEVPALRADAARNVAQLRTAALAAFRGRGLTTPLEEIAAAAGVSKATIYNRFGGRHGLVDAVIGELVATEMYAIMESAGRVEDPWERIATYITDRRDLQYREPAFTDALRMTYPDSEQLVALAQAATEVTNGIVQQGHDAGVLRRDFTAGDLYYADVANGLALLAEAKPTREDYDRRTRLFLDSLHAR